MEQIKDTIMNVMQGLVNKTEGVRDTNGIEDLFKKSLTKRQRQHIKFNYFKKGVINVNVDSSVWLYSLNLQKENLLNRLHKRYKAIQDVRFYLGDIK